MTIQQQGKVSQTCYMLKKMVTLCFCGALTNKELKQKNINCGYIFAYKNTIIKHLRIFAHSYKRYMSTSSKQCGRIGAHVCLERAQTGNLSTLRRYVRRVE